MTLDEVHDVVRGACNLLQGLRGQLPSTISDQAALTLGRGLGLLDNARLMVERDLHTHRAEVAESQAAHTGSRQSGGTNGTIPPFGGTV